MKKGLNPIMMIYTDQIKNEKIVTKEITRRGKKVKQSLDILTFDIEVTSAWMDPGRGLISYEPGHRAEYWNSMEKYALPYIWQFSFNEHVYYNRNIYSFKNVLEDLPQDVEFICWIHNLSYEFAFLINFLTVKKIFARTPHKPMYVIFNEFPNVTFKCSYILTNLSLAQWGKQLGLQKLDTLDYTEKIRTPYTELDPDELDYCSRDCEIVFRGIKDHLQHYKDVWDIPNTSTGKIRRVVKKLVTNDYEYMKDMHKCIPADAIEYKRFQDVFAGGYTHSNRKYTGQIIDTGGEHVDFASSYPYSILAYKYPLNKWSYMGTRLPDPKTFEYRAYIMKLHFKNIHSISWNTYISSSKSRSTHTVYDNGRVIAACTEDKDDPGELWITCTEQDYITICNNYEWDSVESLGTWVCHKRYLPTIFIDYILKLYEDKTMLKGVDPVRYAISKQYINSCFGMMVTSLFSSQVLFNIDKPEQWYMDELTPEQVNKELDKLRVWYNKKYFLSYPVGCWITAYSRRRLWEAMEKIDSRVLYCDTDSIFYTGHYDWTDFNKRTDARLKAAMDYHGIDFERTRPADPDGVIHPLGQFDYEEPWERFISMGAKKYLEERKGRLYMTVAGINKGAVDCLDGKIENFKDGFIFDKDHPSVHKLEHAYLTDMKRVIYPDGFVSDLKYGINMRPTGYQLSEPRIDNWLDILYETAFKTTEADQIKRRGHFNV